MNKLKRRIVVFEQLSKIGIYNWTDIALTVAVFVSAMLMGALSVVLR